MASNKLPRGHGSSAPADREHRFQGRIVRLGPLYVVDVPAHVSEAIGVRGRVPVVFRVNRGAPLRGTLIPAGGGKHRLFVNGTARAGARSGTLAIRVRVDREPREVPLPDDLGEALREHGVFDAWGSIPPSHRREMVRWIDQAVLEATRIKRVARAVEAALRQHEKLVDRGMC